MCEGRRGALYAACRAYSSASGYARVLEVHPISAHWPLREHGV